ncbi:MAG: hypothetical protein PHP05_00105 [Sideroxydans sp.]|nr:hypothetical protein [Sideroxydans sp.]
MQDHLKFLQLLPLPAYQGLELAATAVRALELFSDLVDGQKPPASMAEPDRFDIMDECIDLVVPRSGLPAGFEFTGLTLADMWAALKRAQVPEHELELWSSALTSRDMESLRTAARLRVKVQPDGVFLHSSSLFMPGCMADPDWNTFDPKLDGLMHAANPEWKTPRRSRAVVEVLEEMTQPGRALPVSDLRYPLAIDMPTVPHVRYAQQRLQPQSSDATYHEFQLVLPSVESSYFSRRFLARNVFAWLRVTRYVDESQRPVLVLDEVGCDWTAANNGQDGSFVGDDSPHIPACPVSEKWFEIAMEAFLGIAVKLECKTMAWMSGEVMHRRNPNFALPAAKKLYDIDIPTQLDRLKWNNLLIPSQINVDYPILKSEFPALGSTDSRVSAATESLPGLALMQFGTPVELADSQDDDDIDGEQDDEASFDGPGHGNHWETLYTLEKLTSEVISRDLQDSKLISEHPCVDVVNGTDRSESVYCLRWGGDRIAHDLLVVSNAQSESREFFSAYPVALDGIRHTLELDHFAPWPYGIEAWAYGNVTQGGLPLCFFDTQYYAGSAAYQPGQMLEVSLAAWAYTLQPISLRKFEIKEGPLWEMTRQRRLDDGESEDEAAQAVDIHMTGASIFLPRFGKVAPDEAEYQGVISAVETIAHDGQLVYRLEMVVARPDDDAFKLAVYASEHVLDGYVPRLGEDVQGVLWLQGQIIGLQQSALGNQE